MDKSFANLAGNDADEQRSFRPYACGKPVPTAFKNSDGITVVSDLPGSLPVVREEVALLRAFLSDEIRAILNDED